MVTLGLLLIHSTRFSIIMYWWHQQAAFDSNNTSDTYQRFREDPVHNKRYGKWTSAHLQIMYALYTGNTLGHFLGGIFSDKYGGKHILAISALISALYTSLMPFLLGYLSDIQTIGVHLVIAFVRGMSQPAAASLLARWLPKNALTAPATFLYCVSQMAQTFTAISANYFILSKNYWQGSFFVWTALIIVWYIVYTHMVFPTCEQHPFVCDKEKAIISAEVSSIFPSNIPVKSIFKDTAIWAIVAGMIGSQITAKTIQFTISGYIKINYDINVAIQPFMQFIFYTGHTVCATAVGYFADYLISKNKLDAVYVRSIYVFLGSILCNILFLVASILRNSTIATAIIIIAHLTTIFTVAGVYVNHLDRSRYYAGIIMGMGDGISYFLRGLVGRSIHMVYHKNEGKNMMKAFWFNAALNCYTTLLFLKWCKGERARWDVVETEEQIRIKKLMRDKSKLN